MKKYIDENEYALVVTVDQDDLGRATGESTFSLLYSDGNRWDKGTHDGVIDMLTVMMEVVRMMEIDPEFREVMSSFLRKHTPKIPKLEVVETKNNVIKIDWSNKDGRRGK
tara:strand:+ start:54 stop:383 length:330 start_codon:yes stop_codon:yes gene_type:complete